QLSEASLAFDNIAPVMVQADLDEVRAAVSNLVDNAIKYSGANVAVQVEISMADKKHAMVRVRDQGPGIPKTELKDIFKRFYRVPGTGRGLYIVSSVAKHLGGRAWAESEGAGRGSTFTLQLPLAR